MRPKIPIFRNEIQQLNLGIHNYFIPVVKSHQIQISTPSPHGSSEKARCTALNLFDPGDRFSNDTDINDTLLSTVDIQEPIYFIIEEGGNLAGSQPKADR